MCPTTGGPVLRIHTRPIAISDIENCANVLADGFRNDPLMSAIWPDPERRKAALPGYFVASLRHFHLSGGGVQAAVDQVGDVAAVAVWDPPGRWEISTRAILRAVPAMIGPLGLRTLAALRVLRTLDAHHPHAPHWYLANFASSSTHRSQGFATALLTHQLARCDQDQQASYLVATSEDNVAYYRRFGFQVTKTFSLPGNRATMWAMLRAASGASDRQL